MILLDQQIEIENYLQENRIKVILQNRIMIALI